MRFFAAAAAVLFASSASAAAVQRSTDLDSSGLSYDEETGFSWDAERFKVASIRYPPANFAYPIMENTTWVDLDLNATIAKSVELIKQGAAEGVKFFAFPEVYFPGYPIGMRGNFTPENYAQYVSQSMRFDGPEWKTLTQAFADTKTYGVVSWSEIAGDGTAEGDAIYMAQTLVGPNGEAVYRHRKLRPSGTERNLWSDGERTSIRPTKLPFGTVSMLSCFEHQYAVSRFLSAAQPAHLHVASFPYGASIPQETYWNAPPYDTFKTVTTAYAMSAGVAVILPAPGASTIFDFHNIVLNETLADDQASVEAMPYLTATYNTTTWPALSYDVNGQQSWSAVLDIAGGLSPDVPRQEGAYFGHIVNPVSDLTSSYVQTPGTSCPAQASEGCTQIYPQPLEFN